MTRREVLILVTGTLLLPASAPALRDEPFGEDVRLRQTVTVRVSRMPLAELLQRLGAVLGFRLFAEGEDVAEQKINLFARDLPAAEILTAIAHLLNAEGPRGYWWERSGKAPDHRYGLVRGLASRQWETQRAAEAEVRLVSLLRDRLRALRDEPFRPSPERPRELPAMRKLLGSLSEDQLDQLASDRFLILSAFWDSAQSALWKELSDQALVRDRRRDPEGVQRKIAGIEPTDLVARTTAHIRLYGDPARYRLLMAVGTPAGDPGFADMGQFSDPLARGERAASPRAVAPVVPGDPRQAVLALTPRDSWLMGDVLIDLAVRANINLIADDYTVDWSRGDGSDFSSGLARLGTPQPLSVWLTTIRDELGYAAAQDGPFLRLRNRRWWLDRGREVPERLLARWSELAGGTPEDRLQAAVEIARWAPFAPGSLPLYRLRLGRLANRPEMKERSTQFTDPDMDEVAPGFVEVVADAQAEFRIYSLLSPRQQQAVREEGLTLSWEEMPPPARDLFARRVYTFWEPGIRPENLRQSSLWLQFNNDNILFRYRIAGVPPDRAARQRFILRFAPARPVRAHSLVGLPAPELQFEDAAGKSVSLRPRGPLLLYLAPAWPRPVVTRKEEFADLLALQAMHEAGRRLLVLGTDATAVELQRWWRERRLTLPPRALDTASARLYGVRHQPVAVIVDRDGRVAWAKEGYTPGDEAEWEHELARAGR